MKEGAVDPSNGWHVDAPGYLNNEIPKMYEEAA